MTEFTNKAFSRKQIKLGSDSYSNCTFADCDIEFDGGQPRIAGCSFTACTWSYSGPALATIAWLNFLYADPGFRPLAEDAINQIRTRIRRPD